MRPDKANGDTTFICQEYMVRNWMLHYARHCAFASTPLDSIYTFWLTSPDLLQFVMFLEPNIFLVLEEISSAQNLSQFLRNVRDDSTPTAKQFSNSHYAVLILATGYDSNDSVKEQPIKIRSTNHFVVLALYRSQLSDRFCNSFYLDSLRKPLMPNPFHEVMCTHKISYQTVELSQQQDGINCAFYSVNNGICLAKYVHTNVVAGKPVPRISKIRIFCPSDDASVVCFNLVRHNFWRALRQTQYNRDFVDLSNVEVMRLADDVRRLIRAHLKTVCFDVIHRFTESNT